MISGVRKNIIPQNVTVDICVSGWSRYLFLGKLEVIRIRIEINMFTVCKQWEVN